MTARVTDAAADLARQLSAAEILITRPDQDAQAMVTGGTASGSAAPWNPAAAAVALDIHEGIRRLEASLHQEIGRTYATGTRRGGSLANTYRAIASVVRLSEGVPARSAAEVARILGRWTTAGERLPGVDEAERPQKVAAQCPYCHFPMLRAFPRARKVACLRGYGDACKDGDGNPPAGVIGVSQLDGTPCVRWSDGLVT